MVWVGAGKRVIAKWHGCPSSGESFPSLRWGCGSMVEQLPSLQEALGLISTREKQLF